MLSPVERALTYPYEAPHGSYLFANGRAEPWQPPSAMPERRYPVVGYGSNKSPAQLARKYPDPAERIPVEDALLAGFDVVHSARINGYGAVPATIAPCPRCMLPVKIAWLSMAQFPTMHRSEGIGVAYDFGVLEAPLLAEHSGLLPRMLIYINRSGCFAPEGAPLALAEVAPEGRCWRSTSQRDLQTRLAGEFAPGATVEAFAELSCSNPEERAARSRRMDAWALPWQEPRFRVLSAGDPL
jgi:hypothetical protein